MSLLSSAKNMRALTSLVPSQRIHPTAALEELIDNVRFFFSHGCRNIDPLFSSYSIPQDIPMDSEAPSIPSMSEAPNPLRCRRVRRGNEGLLVEVMKSQKISPFHV
jgi:hypothetical protein